MTAQLALYAALVAAFTLAAFAVLKVTRPRYPRPPVRVERPRGGGMPA